MTTTIMNLSVGEEDADADVTADVDEVPDVVATVVADVGATASDRHSMGTEFTPQLHAGLPYPKWQ